MRTALPHQWTVCPVCRASKSLSNLQVKRTFGDCVFETRNAQVQMRSFHESLARLTLLATGRSYLPPHNNVCYYSEWYLLAERILWYDLYDLYRFIIYVSVISLYTKHHSRRSDFICINIEAIFYINIWVKSSHHSISIALFLHLHDYCTQRNVK